MAEMNFGTQPSYRYLILWYGPWDGETIEIEIEYGADATPRIWRGVAMRVHTVPMLVLRDLALVGHRGLTTREERYMVVPLDEERRPEEFILRASYTAEPA
jgi:hypothetical protein